MTVSPLVTLAVAVLSIVGMFVTEDVCIIVEEGQTFSFVADFICSRVVSLESLHKYVMVALPTLSAVFS
jgi:hypothetical protein